MKVKNEIIFYYNYLNYLDNYIPNYIDFSKNGINTSLLTNENKELFEMENSYYEKLKLQIEKLLQKIRDLQKENDDLKYQIKLKKKNDNTIRAQINFSIKPKKKKILNEIEKIFFKFEISRFSINIF